MDAAGPRVLWARGAASVPRAARLKSTIARAAEEQSGAHGIDSLKVGGLRGDFVIDAVHPDSGAPGSRPFLIGSPACGWFL